MRGLGHRDTAIRLSKKQSLNGLSDASTWLWPEVTMSLIADSSRARVTPLQNRATSQRKLGKLRKVEGLD